MLKVQKSSFLVINDSSDPDLIWKDEGPLMDTIEARALPRID